jgi:hypothetical protein
MNKIIKRVTVNVEVDISDFDVEELIGELKNRYLTMDELLDLKRYLIEALKDRKEVMPGSEVFVSLKARSIIDLMKVEVFEDAMDRFAFTELRRRLA